MAASSRSVLRRPAAAGTPAQNTRRPPGTHAPKSTGRTATQVEPDERKQNIDAAQTHRRRSAHRMLSTVTRRPAMNNPAMHSVIDSDSGVQRRAMPKQTGFSARQGRGVVRGVGKIPVGSASDAGDMEWQPLAQEQGAPHQQREDWRKEGRLAFSDADDEAMRRYVAANSQLKSKGEQLWKNAQEAGITNHSWASMQNHWRKKLARTAPRVPKVASDASSSRQQDLPSAFAGGSSKPLVLRVAPVPKAKPQIGTRAKHDNFDGQWFCGTQSHVVQGESVILESTKASKDNETCELRRTGPTTCQCLLAGCTLGGQLSDDGQQLVWEDGCTWTRKPLGQQLIERAPRELDAHSSRGREAASSSSSSFSFLQNVFKRPKAACVEATSQRDTTRSPRRQGRNDVAFVEEVFTREIPSIFDFPLRCSGDDAWKDKRWDEIADQVGKHFEDPRVHGHWSHFVERIVVDEPWRSTTA